MEVSNHEPHRRASLRGKGRAILLGERSLPAEALETPTDAPSVERAGQPLDPAALRLTPEERRALFDLSAPLPGLYETPPAYAADRQGVPPSQTTSPPSQRGAAQLPSADADELLSDLPDWLAQPDVSEDVPVILGRSRLSATSSPAEDALPLAEREAVLPPVPAPESYQPRLEVESLTPTAPETWTRKPAASVGALERADLVSAGAEPSRATPVQPEQLPSSPETVVTPADGVVTDTAEAVSAPKPAPEAVRLVDDERLYRLARQIEALQEDLARHPTRDPQLNDRYQQALAEADRLLTASPASYDTVRATVYRIRTEITRKRKIEADIARYRPLLLNYLVGWAIALGVLFLLKALFAGVGEAVGASVVGALYYPLLSGIAGALLAGYLTLERHTTRLRDFDPIHISWYLMNPLLGGVMGLLMFLIASLANQDLLRETATEAEKAITYLLCAIAGMNQTPILRTFHDVLRRFGRSSG